MKPWRAVQLDLFSGRPSESRLIRDEGDRWVCVRCGAVFTEKRPRQCVACSPKKTRGPRTR